MSLHAQICLDLFITAFDLTCLPLLASFPGNGIPYHNREFARTVFFTENENKESEVNLCSTVLPFILFYVLDFGCCSPLIPHTSQRHLFQVSASKGTGENKCVLRRPERGHLRANQSRFLLGGPGGARSLVTALWCCWDAKPDVTQTPVGAQGSCCDVGTVYQSKQTVYHRPLKHPG